MSYTYSPNKVPDSLKNAPSLRGFPSLGLEILYGRGFDTEEEIQEHLHTPLTSVINATPMKDCDRGVARLEEAISRGEHIVIYRDYDCDGCCAAGVAVEGLAQLGAHVKHYGNLREIDGYGMCKNGIDNILTNDPEVSLIVTVDNGITACEPVDYAISRGLDVIITDHHQPGKELPRAVAIIDPKREDEVADFRDLCGAGVIFKVLLELYKSMERDYTPVLQCLDLVALATVGDVVPILGENRVLVREGIPYIERGDRPFFRELLRQKQMNTISAHSELAFQIAPLVNAVSRMGLNTAMVVDSFLSRDIHFLRHHVSLLIDQNQQRKERTSLAMIEAKNAMGKIDISILQTCILIKTPSISSGIVGIVAGHLCSEYNKITGVFHAEEGGILKGSMRGVDNFNLKDALDEISEGILISYGGHSKAAGLSLKEEDYDTFFNEFLEIVKKAFPNGTPSNEKAIDVVLEDESDCNFDLIDMLKILEPFGECFPTPRFGIVADIKETRYLGTDNIHVKYKSAKGISYVHWRYGKKAQNANATPSKFVGYPEVNIHNYKKTMQFNCEFQS